MDEDEFVTRAEKVKERLYRMAVMYMGDGSLALDAVSEAMYKALKSLKKLKEPEFFETWLTRIVINECKKELRRQQRVILLDELPETAAEELDTLPLREAIARLPFDLREVIILRFFSGFTQAQTARSLDLPQGTVATRQRRALALLKLELSEDD